MLLAENARSFNHCHDELDWEPVYLFHPLPGAPDPLVVLKAIACLQYQSCEHPWVARQRSAGVLPGAAGSDHSRTARLPPSPGMAPSRPERSSSSGAAHHGGVNGDGE